MRYDEIAALCIRAEKIKAQIEAAYQINEDVKPLSIYPDVLKRVNLLKDQLQVINQAIKNEITQ